MSLSDDVFARMLVEGYDVAYGTWEGIPCKNFGPGLILVYAAACSLGNEHLELDYDPAPNRELEEHTHELRK